MRTRIKPHHLVVGLGVAIALFTAASGIAPSITGFHDDSPVTREVFGNIPGPLKAAFYTIVPILLVYGAVLFANRVKNWERGRPDNRRTSAHNVKHRMADFRAGVYMRTLLREPAAGVMHSLIYFSFLALLGVTTTLEVNHQLPDGLKFLHGDVYKAYSAVGDAAGAVFLVGVVWAILRRYGPRPWRPYRIRIKTRPEHLLIGGVFLAIGVTGFGAEAFRIAADGLPDHERWSFIGYPLAELADGAGSVHGWHQAWWIAHVVAFAAFLVILPTTMLRHMFTSPLNMYLHHRDRPKGAMRPMPDLVEGDTELETFGASVIEDFTWKQLLDTDACTMCGRCTSVCPAHATGKPLDPREIVLKTGEVMARTGSPPTSPPLGTGREGEMSVPANWMFERISNEELWACTSCRACDEICPVNIEILDKILDMRRYLTLMESDFPSELGQAFRGMENSSNPWSMSQTERADWARDLDGVRVIEGGDPFDAEYLYWVGCAGSFDDKNKKVARAMAKLMERAGVDFAILGPAENCTGDSARRSGNEYLFQMLASSNIETLNEMGGAQDRHPVPALLQHARQRVPPAWGALRGGASQPAAGVAGVRRNAGPGGRQSRGAGGLPRQLLSGPPQRRLHGAPAGAELAGRHRGGGGSPQRHQRNVLRCGRRPDVDGGDDRHQGERRAGPGSCSKPVRHASPPRARSVTSCWTTVSERAGVDETSVKVGDIALHVLEAVEARDAARS